MEGVLNETDDAKFRILENCLKGKKNGKVLFSEAKRSENVLELVLTDVYGPIETRT